MSKAGSLEGQGGGGHAARDAAGDPRPAWRGHALTDLIFSGCTPEPNSGCWLWLSSVDAGGYGRLYATGRGQMLAHRASYESFVGPIPAGMCVCHKCDVRSCVNPDHLWLGTDADNTADMVRKGRQRRGVGTHCLRGHEKQLWGGRWRCRECHRESRSRNARLA